MERTDIAQRFKGAIWQTHFSASYKNTKLSAIMEEKIRYYTLYYPFLEKNQILGKVYDELEIPQFCGDVNKRKLHKMYLISKKPVLPESVVKFTRKSDGNTYPVLPLKKRPTPQSVVRETEKVNINQQNKYVFDSLKENMTNFKRPFDVLRNHGKVLKAQKNVRFNEGVRIYSISPNSPNAKYKPVGKLYGESTPKLRFNNVMNTNLDADSTCSQGSNNDVYNIESVFPPFTTSELEPSIQSHSAKVIQNKKIVGNLNWIDNKSELANKDIDVNEITNSTKLNPSMCNKTIDNNNISTINIDLETHIKQEKDKLVKYISTEDIILDWDTSSSNVTDNTSLEIYKNKDNNVSEIINKDTTQNLVKVDNDTNQVISVDTHLGFDCEHGNEITEKGIKEKDDRNSLNDIFEVPKHSRHSSPSLTREIEKDIEIDEHKETQGKEIHLEIIGADSEGTPLKQTSNYNYQDLYGFHHNIHDAEEYVDSLRSCRDPVPLLNREHSVLNDWDSEGEIKSSILEPVSVKRSMNQQAVSGGTVNDIFISNSKKSLEIDDISEFNGTPDSGRCYSDGSPIMSSKEGSELDYDFVNEYMIPEKNHFEVTIKQGGALTSELTLKRSYCNKITEHKTKLMVKEDSDQKYNVTNQLNFEGLKFDLELEQHSQESIRNQEETTLLMDKDNSNLLNDWISETEANSIHHETSPHYSDIKSSEDDEESELKTRSHTEEIDCNLNSVPNTLEVSESEKDTNKDRGHQTDKENKVSNETDVKSYMKAPSQVTDRLNFSNDTKEHKLSERKNEINLNTGELQFNPCLSIPQDKFYCFIKSNQTTNSETKSKSHLQTIIDSVGVESEAAKSLLSRPERIMESYSDDSFETISNIGKVEQKKSCRDDVESLDKDLSDVETLDSSQVDYVESQVTENDHGSTVYETDRTSDILVVNRSLPESIKNEEQNLSDYESSSSSDLIFVESQISERDCVSTAYETDPDTGKLIRNHYLPKIEIKQEEIVSVDSLSEEINELSIIDNGEPVNELDKTALNQERTSEIKPLLNRSSVSIKIFRCTDPENYIQKHSLNVSCPAKFITQPLLTPIAEYSSSESIINCSDSEKQEKIHSGRFSNYLKEHGKKNSELPTMHSQPVLTSNSSSSITNLKNKNKTSTSTSIIFDSNPLSKELSQFNNLNVKPLCTNLNISPKQSPKMAEKTGQINVQSESSKYECILSPSHKKQENTDSSQGRLYSMTQIHQRISSTVLSNTENKTNDDVPHKNVAHVQNQEENKKFIIKSHVVKLTVNENIIESIWGNKESISTNSNRGEVSDMTGSNIQKSKVDPKREQLNVEESEPIYTNENNDLIINLDHSFSTSSSVCSVVLPNCGTNKMASTSTSSLISETEDFDWHPKKINVVLRKQRAKHLKSNPKENNDSSDNESPIKASFKRRYFKTNNICDEETFKRRRIDDMNATHTEYPQMESKQAIELIDVADVAVIQMDEPSDDVLPNQSLDIFENNDTNNLQIIHNSFAHESTRVDGTSDGLEKHSDMKMKCVSVDLQPTMSSLTLSKKKVSEDIFGPTQALDNDCSKKQSSVVKTMLGLQKRKTIYSDILGDFEINRNNHPQQSCSTIGFDAGIDILPKEMSSPLKNQDQSNVPEMPAMQNTSSGALQIKSIRSKSRTMFASVNEEKENTFSGQKGGTNKTNREETPGGRKEVLKVINEDIGNPDNTPKPLYVKSSIIKWADTATGTQNPTNSNSPEVKDLLRRSFFMQNRF